MKRLLTAILILVMFSAPSLINAQRPDAPTYAKPGPYAVGVLPDLVIQDAARPLHVTVWYPAAADAKGPIVRYQRRGAGKGFINATPDPKGGPYPLIVFSHGFLSFRDQSTFLTEQLASWGFVVISADHPGTDQASTNLFGTQNTIFTSLVERPQDVIRQIDFAAALSNGNGPLKGLINTDMVGVTGHSMGGYTSVAAGGARIDFGALRQWCDSGPAAALKPSNVCFLESAPAQVAALGYIPAADGLLPAVTDPRIKAVAPLAPWNAPTFGPKGLAAVNIPMLIMVGTTDETTPAERDAYAVYEGISSTQKGLVAFESGSHLLFLDPCESLLILPEACIESVWDKARVHDITNHFATAFFSATLKDDQTASGALQPDSVAFTGILYRATFSK